MADTPETTDFELQFTGVERGDLKGDVNIKVTYPAGKAMLALSALTKAGSSEYGARLAGSLQQDHSIAEALAAAGITLSGGTE